MSKEKELDEFEFQLRAQQEYSGAFRQTKDAQQQDSDQSQATFVDPSDGTIYEWDPEKRAWFPKVTYYATCGVIVCYNRLFACLFVGLFICLFADI